MRNLFYLVLGAALGIVVGAHAATTEYCGVPMLWGNLWVIPVPSGAVPAN